MHPYKSRSYAVVMVLALSVAACAGSSSAIRNHSHAAETLDELAGDGKALVLELRQAELDKALAAAQQSGSDPRAAVTAAAAAFDARPLVPALNAFIEAKEAYVRAVLLALQKEPPDWTTVKPLLKDAAAAYTALRTATGDKLPAIPKVVIDLLE